MGPRLLISLHYSVLEHSVQSSGADMHRDTLSNIFPRTASTVSAQIRGRSALNLGSECASTLTLAIFGFRKTLYCTQRRCYQYWIEGYPDGQHRKNSFALCPSVRLGELVSEKADELFPPPDLTSPQKRPQITHEKWLISQRFHVNLLFNYNEVFCSNCWSERETARF